MYLFDNDFEFEHRGVPATPKQIFFVQDFLLNSAANEKKNALPIN